MEAYSPAMRGPLKQWSVDQHPLENVVVVGFPNLLESEQWDIGLKTHPEFSPSQTMFNRQKCGGG